MLNPIGERIVEMFVQNNKRRNNNGNNNSSSNINNNNNPTINVQSVEDGTKSINSQQDDDVSSDSCCDMEDRIHFEDFARTFATFRPINKNTATYAVNSREAKVIKLIKCNVWTKYYYNLKFQIKYLFSMVDMQGEGQFTVDNLHDLLEQMMGAKVE